ncbi:hypothetical protein EST38_g6559 [Candolleomyces aberdarensis]|uniref:NACHT domain-containing protein n=1 Tax=Candolleomyces aberdarensis TaxID=2316362 RepID=A0A4Q2DKB9_9AGAR|nr:hypothetical protein EST38_g6559 [Candolleomyces aberdarensis]
MSIPELAPHIRAAVKRNPMVLNKALEFQLMTLIVEPFKSLGELDEMPHRLVIVDGLDECIKSDQESRVEKQYAEDQERIQIRVLDLIFIHQSHHLLLWLLILSRPEPWIKQHIGSKSFQAITEILVLYQVGDHMKDVEIFVKDELARISESLDRNPGGHMLYAATVIRVVYVDDFKSRPPFPPFMNPIVKIFCDAPMHIRPLWLRLSADILASHPYIVSMALSVR